MKSLPKIELHLHLEGAAEPDFVRMLAQEKNIDLAGVFDESGAYAYDGFLGFLRCYEAATAVLKTPEDYARLTASVLDGLEAHGVIYAETFVSPEFCGGGDVAAWKEYLHAMEEASAQAAAQGGPILKGIVTPIRHLGPETAKASAICAAETVGDWVVGLGMGGDENQGNPRDFAWSFDCAREAGLRLTNHAGEWRGPESVRESIEDLGVERIGHGVRSVEDPALVEYLVARGVVLEVCPGSNVALGVYPDWSSHPIARLRDAGVKVTVSTDDPPFFHTTMTHEYERLADVFGWGVDDFAALNRVAAEAAFCDADTRSVLLKKLEQADV